MGTDRETEQEVADIVSAGGGSMQDPRCSCSVGATLGKTNRRMTLGLAGLAATASGHRGIGLAAGTRYSPVAFSQEGEPSIEPPEPASVTEAEEAPTPRLTHAPIQFIRFGSPAAFATGLFDGTAVNGDAVELNAGSTTGTWVSPPVDPGFPFNQLIASWNAGTPGASWLQIEVQATTATNRSTRWYVLGIWADDDGAVKRTSVAGQVDGDARVATDTLVARGQPLAGYILRVTLTRPSAAAPSPALAMIGAVVTGTAALSETDGPSAASGGEPIALPVPAYSQMIHAGHYPQWGGGGEVWCSPTSTQMVVEYWGQHPAPEELAWIARGYPDPSVAFAARQTYDAAYRGTGNWPFNTAYAARYGLAAFVTQLRSLAEAEPFLQSGIPLVASIRARPGELDGFPLPNGTNGHLLVVVGFDAAGNPVVNDPAAASNRTVRRTYDRAQFERAWQRGSGGVVYVIHPPDVPLPPNTPGATPNW
jgi:hypothetical protein